eukprot:11051130-Lingulodinium_polyedra.AAC.1
MTSDQEKEVQPEGLLDSIGEPCQVVDVGGALGPRRRWGRSRSPRAGCWRCHPCRCSLPGCEPAQSHARCGPPRCGRRRGRRQC